MWCAVYTTELLAIGVNEYFCGYLLPLVVKHQVGDALKVTSSILGHYIGLLLGAPEVR